MDSASEHQTNTPFYDLNDLLGSNSGGIFRSIIESSDNKIYIIDRNYRIVYFNASYARYIRELYNIELTIGVSPLDLLNTPEYREKFLLSANQALAGQTAVTEARNGVDKLPFYYYKAEYNPIRNGNGEISGVSVIITDLTSQKKAEEKDIESQLLQARLAAIVESTDDAIISKSLDGTVLSWNQGATRLYGYTAEEMIGNDFSILLPDNLSDEIQIFMGKIGRGENITHYETQRKHKNGKLIEVMLTSSPVRDETGKIIASSTIAHDITEHKRVERELLESHQRIATILESINDGFFALDAEERFTFVNNKSEQLFHSSREEMVGNRILDLYPGMVHSRLFQYFRRAIAEQVPLELEDHSEYLQQWVDVKIYPAGGGVAVYFRDISAQKLAELALRRSEARFQTFMKNGPLMAWIMDYEGTIHFSNQSLTDGSRGDADDLIGKNVLKLYSDGTGEKFLDKGREVMDTGITTRLVEDYLRPNGELRYALIYRFPLPDQGANCPLMMGGIGIDISEAILAEEALARSEEDFRALVENSPDQIVRTDLDLRCLYANPELLRIARVPKDEVIGKTGHELGVPQVAWKTWVVLRDKVLETGLPQAAEFEMPMTYGATFYFQTRMAPEFNRTGEIETLLVVTRDLTELKKAQEELIDQARFKALFELSPDAVCLTDSHAHIISCNRALETLYGIPRAELLGQKVSTKGLISQQYLDLIRDHSLNHREPLTLQITVRAANGTDKTCELRVQPVSIGNQPHFLSTVRDITLRKQFEQELKTSLEKQRELTELKDRFISTTSHEFRTPLAIIQASGEALNRYIDKMSPEQIRVKVDKIKEQVQYIVSLLNDVLVYSRLQDGQVPYQMEPGDLTAFSRAAIQELIEGDAGKHKIVQKFPDNPVVTDFNNFYMQKVVGNLISNALKFSPVGSTVEIELVEQKDQVTLKISDQGIGIPENELNIIFEPFHRGENASNIQGTGMGLAIVYDAIKRHEGSIKVNSKPGEGTTFQVVLPRTQI